MWCGDAALNAEDEDDSVDSHTEISKDGRICSWKPN